MKTPITYYGGKQRLVSTLLPLFPQHVSYIEPFTGGGALFFAKPASEVEVLNDINKELINFFSVVKKDFVSLEKMISITLHSRTLHSDASVVYNNPHLFTELQRAWAVWVTCAQSFSSQIGGSFGYDKKTNSTTRKITNKREGFTSEYAIRLQNVTIECADAIYVIKSRDTKDAFFYCDPPYYNSDCGPYAGYTAADFERLLITLSKMQGRFLLSSYPSDLLEKYTKKFGWHQKSIEQQLCVTTKTGKRKTKTEVITANYPI